MVNISNKLIKISYCSIDFATITILHTYRYTITCAANANYAIFKNIQVKENSTHVFPLATPPPP